MNNFEVTLSNGEHITVIAESWVKAIETFYKTQMDGVLTEIKLVNYGRIIYIQNTGDHESFAEHYGCREETPIEKLMGKSLPPDGSIALSANEVEQLNNAISKALYKEQHLSVGPTYEELENSLLGEQEENLILHKEIDRLTALLKERDAEITDLCKKLEEYKDCNQDFYKNEIAERDCIIGTERIEMQKLQECIQAKEDEIATLKEFSKRVKYELADVQEKNLQLRTKMLSFWAPAEPA